MNSIKCKNCGLVNPPSVFDCCRCGLELFRPTPPPKRVGKKPRPFSIWSLLMIALVAGVVYYFYNGVQKEMETINAEEAKRSASQPSERPTVPGLSRNQYDRQRAGSYGNAVSNSASIGAHNQHIKDTEKAMQQVSNSR